ncbi:LURP-one-related/scramblase family protein [Corynebacterium sp. p3-SID1056]|uniref:LURP-one-related/scramblase family protein n=1 Tax=Corynebacterium sp. p3-SID1056 TaxID=2916092 RepID=UPI0021A4FFAB|nr:LURP-one-related family protein [Corynebacterium sp. p3-SID1056]MCT2339621.1 LURP-one-related family protein [Corynebacterium sp. p3-SID1056]
MLDRDELIFSQTKALGTDEFEITDAAGTLVGTARQTLKLSDLFSSSRGTEVRDAQGNLVLGVTDPVNWLHDSYEVRLADPDLPLATLRTRFAWLRTKLSLEIAGFPEVEVDGKLMALDFTLTSMGREIARITAEYSGMGRMMMGKTTYRITFAPGLDERQHAAILGSAVALDMLRRKRRNSS